MQAALAAAAIEPGDIDYINLHGTGTPSNDRAESQAVTSIFGATTPCSSTKGATGHMLGAAGAVEMIVCAKAIQTNSVPPTINYAVPDPECDLDYVPNMARELKINAIINNSFGFGGHNASIAAKKFTG